MLSIVLIIHLNENDSPIFHNQRDCLPDTGALLTMFLVIVHLFLILNDLVWNGKWTECSNKKGVELKNEQLDA